MSEKFSSLIDLEAVIKSAQELSPLPTSVTRLASLVLDESGSLTDIVEVISFDQSLTAKLLRVANSGASASKEPITSVHDAALRMGVGLILEVAMAVCVSERLEQQVPEYGLTEGELWRHSVAASIAVDLVKHTSKVEMPKECFTAALLHDVGKLVLRRFLKPDVLTFLREARAKGGSSEREAESEILSVHHGEVGGLVAQHWKLPNSIIQAIIYHHTPELTDSSSPYFVQMANLIAKKVGTGTGPDTIDPKEWETATRFLGLKEEDIEEVCDIVLERLDDVSSRYALHS